MKKLFLPFVLSLLFISTVLSQDYSTKYGNITADELNMKVYDKDSDAVAVVLYNIGDIYYQVNANSFQVVTEKSVKIKILKQEGTDEATVTIPYYEESHSYRDNISKLEAVCYNLEDGKVVKSKLEKKYIFTEQIRKNVYQMKFTIPNVKVGSVIEYKYKIESDRYSDVPDLYLQQDIPVAYVHYLVTVPEYFIYNIEIRGFEKVDFVKSEGNQTFTISGGGQIASVTAGTLIYDITMHHVPGLKDEPYVWDKDDYRSVIAFELSATKFPNDFYKPFTSNWANLEASLKDKTDVITNTNKSEPYKNELSAILSKIGDSATDADKINLIFQYIKGKIAWDGNYSFWDNDPKEAEKKGSGNNAQINSVLIKALKDFGYNAYPVLISNRSNGRLPLTYASMDKLNTYLVGIQLADGTNYYLDGSSKYGGINMLPTELLVDRAYAMNDNGVEKWVDLTNLTRNIENKYIMAILDENGQLKATLQSSYAYLEAFYFKSQYKSAKDSADYIKNIEEKYQIKIDSMTISNNNLTSSIVTDKMDFTKDYEVAGDFIYINPIIFSYTTENKFTQSDRKLPIEFSYPYTYNYFINLQIPEGYSVSELPKSMNIILNNNQASCLYMIQQKGNSIQLNYKFVLKQILYPQTEYSSVRGFWGQVVSANNEMIVLKKN